MLTVKAHRRDWYIILHGSSLAMGTFTPTRQAQQEVLMHRRQINSAQTIKTYVNNVNKTEQIKFKDRFYKLIKSLEPDTVRVTSDAHRYCIATSHSSVHVLRLHSNTTRTRHNIPLKWLLCILSIPVLQNQRNIQQRIVSQHNGKKWIFIPTVFKGYNLLKQLNLIPVVFQKL